MERLCVLLYSKYSPMSNKLISILSSCQLDLKVLVGLSTVCIDNKEIRKQILQKNNKIEILSVPCILIVYHTGEVEKYEGESAFEWIEETINKYMPQPELEPQIQHEPQPQPQPQPQRQPQPQSQRQTHTRKQVQKEEEEDIENEYIEEPEPRQKKISQKRVKKETTMEELGFEPTVKEETENKVSSVKGKDLMSAAMAMQKERDSSESNKGKDNTQIITNQGPI